MKAKSTILWQDKLSMEKNNHEVINDKGRVFQVQEQKIGCLKLALSRKVKFETNKSLANDEKNKRTIKKFTFSSLLAMSACNTGI